MDQVELILEKMKSILIEMGFKKIVITNPYRSEINYVRNDVFCIPRYVEGLGFLIEYADSYEQAQNHGHEDGDAFPISMGEDNILLSLTNEIHQMIT